MKIKNFILTLLGFMCAIGLQAAEQEMFTYTSTNADQTKIALNYLVLTKTGNTGTVRLISHKALPNVPEYAGDIDIPATVTNKGVTYSVTEIGNREICLDSEKPFMENKKVTSVKITNSVLVGYMAFQSCQQLRKVDIGNITHIYDYAFEGCENLQTVNLRQVASIGSGAFNYCQSLDHIILERTTPPVLVPYEGTYDQFENCKFTVITPKGAIETYKNAEGWKTFTDLSYTDDPDYNKYINEKFTFTSKNSDETETAMNYKILTDNKQSRTARVISHTAIPGVPEYAGNIDIPETVTYKGLTYDVTEVGNKGVGYNDELAFYNCNQLISLRMTKVKIIGNSCISGNENLEKIELGAVTTLYDYSLTNNNKLRSINLPQITTIYSYALSYCSSLSKIIIEQTTPPTLIAYRGEYHHFQDLNAVFIVPKGYIETFKNAEGWNTFTNLNLQDDINYDKYKDVKFTFTSVNSDKKSIAMNYQILSDNYQSRTARLISYKELPGVTKYAGNVDIPETIEYKGHAYEVTEIGSEDLREYENSPFYNCDQLTSVSMSKVKTIGAKSFAFCTNLENIEIGTVSKICSFAFRNCLKLKKINLRQTSSLQGDVFTGCQNLKKITTESKTPPTLTMDSQNNCITFPKDQTITVTVPKGCLDTYKNAEGWNVCTSLHITDDPEENEHLHDVFTYTSTNTDRTKIALNYKVLTDTKDSRTVTVVAHNAMPDVPEYAGNIDIPETVAYSGHIYTVTEVGKSINSKPTDIPFSKCQDLTSVSMTSVKTIGYQAFFSCTNLRQIEIGAVTEIGQEAFSNCLNLSSFNLHQVEYIGSAAFSYCNKLRKIIVERETPAVMQRNKNAYEIFHHVIATVVVPKGSTNNYLNAEGWNSYLYIGFTEDPNTTRYVGDAFTYTSDNSDGTSTAMNYLVVTDNDQSRTVRLIHKGALPNVKSYEGNIDVPQTISYHGITYDVNEIGSYVDDPCEYSTINAFENCPKLISVKIGKIKHLGIYSFNRCKELNNVEIGEVENIDDYNFAQCPNLTKVNLHKVSHIGKSAFQDCKNLKVIALDQEIPPTLQADNGGSYSNFNGVTAPFKVPSGCIDTYKNAEGWNSFPHLAFTDDPTFMQYFGDKFTFTSKNSDVTTIAMNYEVIADSHQSKYVRLLRHDALPNVAQYAGNVDIPEKVTYQGQTYLVTEIGKDATSVNECLPFQNCPDLVSVKITKTKTIGRDAFKSCINLTKVDLGEVDRIAENAFTTCTSLKSLSIKKVNSIGNNAFQSCSKLKQIVLEQNIPATLDSDINGSYHNFENVATTVYLPKGSLETYQNAEGWKTFSNFIFTTDAKDNMYLGENFTYTSQNSDGTSIAMNYKVLTDTRQSRTVRLISHSALPGVPQYAGDIDIPETVTFHNQVYSVTEAGCVDDKSDITESPFYNAREVTSISMTKVKSIGQYFAQLCNLLQKVDLGEATTISKNAFASCVALRFVNMNHVTEIHDQAFYDCKSLKRISILNCKTPPLLFTSENSYLNFENNETTVIVPKEQIESFKKAEGWNSFTHFYYTDDIDAEMNQGKIFTFTSKNSDGTSIAMNYIILNDNNRSRTVRLLESRAMPNVPGYKGNIDIPETVEFHNHTYTVTEVGDYEGKEDFCLTFFNCYGVTSLRMSKVQSIGRSAIINCRDLTKVDLGEVTKIAETAFANNKQLHIVHLNNVSAIKNEAFIDCPNLQYIIVKQTTPAKLLDGASPNEYNHFKNVKATVIVPNNCVETYKNAEGWKEFPNLTFVDKNVKNIDDKRPYLDVNTDNIQEINYTRHFAKAMEWQPLYVPFDMTYDNWKDKFDIARINNFIQTDEDNNGSIDKTILEVVYLKEGSHTEANMLYVIRAKQVAEGGEDLNIRMIAPEGGKLTVANTESKSIECASFDRKYVFTGIYEPKSHFKQADYVMGGGKIGHPGPDAILKGFRWFLTISNRSGQLVTGVNSIRIIEREDGLTGIDTAAPDTPKHFTIYDLNGRLVKANATNTDALAPGIYIVNGKKFMK